MTTARTDITFHLPAVTAGVVDVTVKPVMSSSPAALAATPARH